MPHCNTIARHTAITAWERIWPSGDPEANFMKALEATTAKAFKLHTGEILEPGVLTVAYRPVYDDTAPKPLIITIHAWWNRHREGRRLLIEQSISEWVYALDNAFAEAVVKVIVVGAWNRENRYENMDAMPVYELLGIPTASAFDYHFLGPLELTLVKRDVRFVGELITCTADALANLTDRLTQAEIQEIRLKLSEHGLALKGEQPIPELVPVEL